MRVNAFEIQLRFEGLDEMLKALLVDKVPFDHLLKHLLEKPEQFIDILKNLADKVNI
jgi:hypothetical protein